MKEKCIICKTEKDLELFKLNNSNKGSVCNDCYEYSLNKISLHKKYDAYFNK